MNYNEDIKQEFLDETKAELQKELELENLSELSNDAQASITGGLSAYDHGASLKEGGTMDLVRTR